MRVYLGPTVAPEQDRNRLEKPASCMAVGATSSSEASSERMNLGRGHRGGFFVGSQHWPAVGDRAGRPGRGRTPHSLSDVGSGAIGGAGQGERL